MLKKFFIITAVLISIILLPGCTKTNQKSKFKITKDNIKVGFVYNGFINDEGYTEAHDAGRKALNEMGIKTLYVENIIDKGLVAYDIIEDLIAEGCNVIYATSYGFMDSVEKAAREHPDVIFGHCSGYKRAPNLSTYYGKMYQARYLAGIVAGLKTKTNRIGYIAAYQIPECVRGINAFALGAQSVNPNAEVYVSWTNTWYNPKLEKEGALKVLKLGCDIVEQHQDTPAPQLTAQDAGAYCLGYNFSPERPFAPNSFLAAPVFHWDIFIKDDIQRILDGTWESRAYWEGLDKGVVELADISPLCAPGTEEKVQKAENSIINGDLKIFSGRIYDNQGNLKLDYFESLTDEQIWNMDWFVKGVHGEVK